MKEWRIRRLTAGLLCAVMLLADTGVARASQLPEGETAGAAAAEEEPGAPEEAEAAESEEPDSEETKTPEQENVEPAGDSEHEKEEEGSAGSEESADDSREAADGAVEAFEAKDAENTLTYEVKEDGTAEITGPKTVSGDLVIPEEIDGYRVTSIGRYAFEDCSGLTGVSIPGSVTSIGDSAFRGCSGLTGVSIPGSVTSIGDSAFSGCSGLKSAGPLGGGYNYEFGWVNDIPDSAFEECRSLTSVSIPGSVTSIGRYAFCGCSGLTSVSIPGSVTSIGKFAFWGCSGLTSVSIPGSVMSIGDSAFFRCGGLTSIRILNPVCAICSSETFPANTVIYGYTGSTAESYAKACNRTFISVGTVLLPGESLETVATVSDNDLRFHVYGSDRGELTLYLEDAGICVDGFGTASTDKKGNASIPNTLADQAVVSARVTITKEGYRDYCFDQEIYHKDAQPLWDFNTVCACLRKLEEGDQDRPYISTLMCRMPYGKVYNAMTVGGTVYETSGSAQNVKLQMNAVWNGKTPSSYVLYQKDGASYTSTDGNFQLDMGEAFAGGQPVYAKLVASDGTTVEEETRLEIRKGIETAAPGDGLDLIDTGSTGTLGEDVAFLSGESVGIKLKGVKMEVSVEAGKIKVMVGKKLSEGEKFSNRKWEEWKKLCEEQPSQWRSAVDSLDTNWTESVKGKTEVCGYLEGSINQEGDTVIAGKLKLKTSLSAGLQAQYVIGVVPVYAKVSIGADGGAEGALAYNWTQKKLDGQKSGITLSIEPFLAAEAGVGVMAVATVGLEGKGSLPVSTKLGSREGLKVSLKGTLSLKAKLLMFEYSLKLAERERTLLPREETAALSALSMDEFELSDDSYTERESLWLGEDGGLQAFSLEMSEKGCVERVLKTNINPDADTQLIDAGGTKMILWTEGDSARAAVNNSKLVYSLYDPQKDAWSEPLAVADDGTADYAPAVATDGTHIYAAWQNINKKFDDQAGLADVAAASEIVLSVWTAGQGFSEPKVVSESGAAAVLPKVALDGDGSPYVVYLQNTDNNLLLNTGVNRIQCVAADGGAVRRQTLVEDAGLVTALDTAYADGCEVSYTVDTDGDLSTLDDREIVSTGTAASTQNGCMDSNAQYVENGGRRLRFWYQDGRIVMSDGSGAERAVCEDETGALTDDFHVVSGQAGQLAVVWTAVDEAGNRQIEGCLYDSEEDRWSRSIRISDTDAGVFRPRGIFTQDGKLEFLYRKTGAERTDLCLLTAAPSVDLALVHAYCDETALEPGQTAKVRVQVRNQGTKSADGYTVAVAGTKTMISETLAPGEEAVVEADYPVPEELTCQEIEVTAETDGDVDESNNRFDLAVGHTDLVMNLLSDCYEFGHLAEVRVANESCVDTEAVLEIHKGRRGGELVKRMDLGVLRRGEVTTVTYLWNELTENYSQETSALFFDVIAEKPEKYTDNNYDFMVTGTGNVELPEEAALTELTVSKEKTQYRPGDVLNVDDLTVTAGYSDGTSRPVTGYTTNASELDLSAEGTKTLTVTYQENGVTKEAFVEIVVKAGSSVDVPGTCTVTFDVRGHGTAPGAQTGIGLGEKVREPERPAADGYLFTGWYRDAECTVKWDFASDTVEGDMTLYAGWIQQEPDQNKAAAPTADVPSGSEVTEGTRVVLSTVTDGAAIYYTTDGSTPARDSLLYKDAIVIEHTVTIRAIAVKEGYEDSEIAEFTYSVKQEMQDWGDLTEEDRALYNNPSEIPENFWLAGIPEHAAYTGKAVTFAARVYDHKTLLAEKRDYTISYKNNKNAADASRVPASKAPAVIIKGRNNFAGTITRTFTILPADIGGDGFRAEDIYRLHTGKVQKAPAVLYQNGRVLKKGRDYVLSYEDTGKNAYTGAGSWKITITGRGNYTGTRTVQEVIGTGTLMSRAKVSPVKAQEYTGEAICPVPEVAHGRKKLTGMEASRYEAASAQERAAVDYLYTYADNREAGSARLILTGVNDYFGQVAKTFQITGTPLARCILSGFENTLVYTGAECTQDAVFTAPAGSGKSGTLTGMPAEAYEAADAAARAGVDYTYEYQNHTKAGRAAVIYRGVNGYSGTLKKSYRIAAYDLKEDSGGRITVTFDASVPYAKGGAGPEPVVTFRYGGTSRVLTAGTDYTVRYVNHKAVSGSSDKRPELLIQGRGNFTGKRLAGTFSVVPQDIGTLAMTVQDVAYKKKANIYRSALTVTDRNGKKLAAGTDYEKTAAYEYAEDTAVLQRVNGKDTEILRRAGDPVDAKDIIPAGARIRVTVTGRKNYSGTLSAVFRFTKSSLAGAKVTVSAQYYTGRAIEPDRDQITVKVGGTALGAEDYEIIGYANNRKKGTAQVTIRGIGNYGGTKTVNFRIQSRVMSITVRPGGKSISSDRENRAGILMNPSEFLIGT